MGSGLWRQLEGSEGGISDYIPMTDENLRLVLGLGVGLGLGLGLEGRVWVRTVV